MIGHKFFHEINNNQWIKASSSTSKLTGNYISGELVVPHYKNVFSGVFGSFFAKFTHGILTGKRYLLCLFSFLLAALSFCSHWNSNFVPLSVYLYLSHFYMFRVASTLGTALPSPLPWMSIPYKEYWYLCYDSILACCRSWMSSYSMILPLFD